MVEPAHGRRWKRRVLAAVLGVVIGFASLLVSNDLRAVYGIGAVLLFVAAAWLTRRGSASDWPAAALLAVPPLGMFAFFVLQELPCLWPQIVFWIAAVVIGTVFMTLRRAVAATLIAVFVIASGWYCMVYSPNELARALSRVKNATALPFDLQPVSGGETIPGNGMSTGKILVLDFFSTTCVPCIAELPELAAVRGELNNRRDVEFVVVATDRTGDSPERFRAFAARRAITLPLAFDRGGKAQASFGLKGTPTLVVLDATGHVRFTHQGYNAAESNFRRDLVQVIRAL